MKRMRLLVTCLLLAAICSYWPSTALAKNDSLTFSSETCIFSISSERFVRKASALASLDECGKDEYATIRINIKNTSDSPAVLKEPCISIDGGEKRYWTDSTIGSGQSALFHLYYVNAQKLTPGLHTAAFYASGKQLYTCRFNIGRAWKADVTFPSAKECKARSVISSDFDKRSPYLASWLSIDSETRYDGYCVDIKADYLPNGTYCSGFNGYLDLSSLKKTYKTVSQDGISCYAGLQNWEEGKGTGSILSFWDIFCTDRAGKTTTIRAKRIESTGKSTSDSFGGEGTGAHTILPYEWQAGRWYRMLLLCGVSEESGNTTVEQWFQDLVTNEWSHMCTYDTGIPDSCFIGPAAFFLENYLTKYAGDVRTMEVANVRIHTVSDGAWHDVTRTGPIEKAFGTGSWQAGADEHSFYMMTTGVSKWDSPEKTKSLTIRNLENGSPIED